jgi:hypothetical protein
MPLGELVTRWTIRLSLLLYASALAARLLGRGGRGVNREARLAWTAGCGCLWLHMAAAFHFYHAWSHQAAYEATARDTQAIIGIPFGGGVYFNYVFAALWTADCVAWWRRGLDSVSARHVWMRAAVHAFMAFIVFNATVVFAEGALRWVATGVFALLAAAAIHAWCMRRSKRRPE